MYNMWRYLFEFLFLNLYALLNLSLTQKIILDIDRDWTHSCWMNEVHDSKDWNNIKNQQRKQIKDRALDDKMSQFTTDSSLRVFVSHESSGFARLSRHVQEGVRLTRTLVTLSYLILKWVAKTLRFIAP